MTFRPYPGLTIACVLLFAILCGLGFWQLERLQWKLALIARVDSRMAAPPLPLDRVMALPQDDAQYRRVTLTGRFDHAREAYVFTTADGAAVYHVLTPFHTEDGHTLMVDRGEVPKEKLAPATRDAGNITGDTSVTGVWRLPDAPGAFTPQPDTAHRVWYARDLKGIAAADHLTLSAPVVIEADATPTPGGWPKGGQTVVTFRNQHLSYAVTWFGLALGLLGIWFAYNFRADGLPSNRWFGGESGPITAAMNFLSTRGHTAKASFSDVLLAGLAPDGGLYLPESWPNIPADEIARFKGARYQDVAFAVLSRFTAGSFSDAELREAIEAAYSDFDAPEIAPLVQTGDNQYLLELFHGPTLAFKDIALQILGQLFSRALAKRGGRATIVAATSGDTGSAAIAALGGLPNISVFVMHPKGRVSDVQRLQMTTSTHANVHNIALEGSFDDAQSIVKSLFADTGFAEQISLTAVNSINFARIAAQCVYYFTATAALGVPATFVVPTGNFGDIFAGEAAFRMGLDVARLVIATNANDIMARALNEGTYEAGASHATLSPSMDIQVASNFERALFEACDRDADWTAAAMNDFTRERRLGIPQEVLASLRSRYSAFSCNDDETRAAIAATYTATGRIIDPHTAVGMAAAMLLGKPASPVVVLSTAHPAKFPDAVTQAIGAPPAEPKRLAGLKNLPERLDVLPRDMALIKQFISSRLAA